METRDVSAPKPDRFLFLAFLLVMFWLPLPVASNHLWAWSFVEVCIFALAVVWLVLFALGRVNLTPTFRQAWPALCLFVVFFAWVLVQLAPLDASLVSLLSPNGAEINNQVQAGSTLSLDPAATRSAALKTLAYGLLFVLTLLLIDDGGRLRALALVLVFSGVFQAAFGALMMLSGLEFGFFSEKQHNRGVATGTFVNPNHLAGYLEMCLALGVGLILASMSSTPISGWRDRLRRILSAVLGDKARVRIALMIMVVGLVLSQSRMGNVAFLTSLLIAGGYYVLVSRRTSVGTLAFFASVLLIDLLVIGSYFGIEEVADEIRNSSMTTEVPRIDVGRDTLNIVRDYPLTGTGAGSFASIYPMYDSGRVGFFYYKHAHNDYLQFAAELGLPGLMMLSLIVLLSLWHSARAQFKRRRRLLRGLGAGVSMAIIALLIHSAVDFNLQIPANAATFIVVLAMGWLSRFLRPYNSGT